MAPPPPPPPAPLQFSDCPSVGEGRFREEETAPRAASRDGGSDFCGDVPTEMTSGGPERPALCRANSVYTAATGPPSSLGGGGSSGGGSLSGGAVANIWNRLVSRGDVIWDDGSLDDEEAAMASPPRGGPRSAPSCRDGARRRISAWAGSLRRFGSVLRRRPAIPLVTLAVFTALTWGGLASVASYAHGHAEEMRTAAVTVAREAGEWFGDEFDKALLPLFTLAQLVKHDERFRSLAGRIGNRGEPGAAPGWPGRETELRDVRGICDDAELMEHFARVAESVKRDSGLGSVLSNLRLAPMGVMCLIHPVLNYDDYEGRGYHNVTKRLYNDWATDSPRHMDSLAKTLEVQADETRRGTVTVSGPFRPESAAGDGSLLTESLFCPHLGVYVPDHRITVRNVTYESWGFVFAYMNWGLLVERSDMHARFEEMGLVFRLDRSAEKMDRDKPYTFYQDTHVLAQSRNGCVSNITQSEHIRVDMTVNGDAWTLTTGYLCGLRPPWQTTAEVTVVMVALVGSVLLMLVLVEKRQHKDLLYRMMPPSAVRKLNRGQTVVEKYDVVTVFFSDIVGFTAMAGEMRPVEVMRMLNALYVELDRLVDRHGVYKVETIGDAYMVLGGAPDRAPGPEGAGRVALFALDAVRCVRDFRFDGNRIFIRAGMASGPVAAGVVGSAMPRYCLFGDTVNLASRMESTSETMRIQCSDLTGRLLREVPDVDFELRERRGADGRRGVDVKGKGRTDTWWIQGAAERDAPSLSAAEKGGMMGRGFSRRLLFHRQSSIPHDVHAHAAKFPGGPGCSAGPMKRRDSGMSAVTVDFVPDVGDGGNGSRFLRGVLPRRRRGESRRLGEGRSMQRAAEPSGGGGSPSFRTNKLSWTAILVEANSQAASSAVAEALTEQRWTCLGQGKDPLTAATDHTGIMIDRIAAILEHRLEAVWLSRGVLRPAAAPPAAVVEQLRAFVAEIEALYNDVHYHSFQHASHVAISANKLIDLLQKNRGDDDGSGGGGRNRPLRNNPLAHFALVFAVLVHDVDHRGVSNRMLVRQGHELAERYGGRSVAERHSVDVALRLLREPRYGALRAAVAPDGADRAAFARIVRGTVLCTDIACEEQVAGCRRRWERSVRDDGGGGGELGAAPDCAEDAGHSHGLMEAPWLPDDGDAAEDGDDDGGNESRRRLRCPFPSDSPASCLRGCVVLEHMIQIADVAHTMQGWGTFVKWNYRLLRELYDCHRRGLMPDPAPGWADGQVSFLEGYVLPLAERMDGTGALGTDGSRLVRRARENCARWAEAGRDIAVVMANGIAGEADEDRIMQTILLRAFRAGERSLLWDESTEAGSSTDGSNDGGDDDDDGGDGEESL